jgi:beta-phosphoglucomutase
MKAILFDFDGVIADSEPIYAEVENKLFSKMVSGWQRKFSEEIIGLDPHSTFLLLKNKHGLKISEAEFRAEYDKGYPMVYGVAGLTKKALEMLNFGAEHGARMGIVSSTPSKHIMQFLQKNQIRHFIEEIFSSADLKIPSKPAPAPYNFAVEKLKLDKNSTIVVEDSFAGTSAAHAAGLFTVGYNTIDPECPCDCLLSDADDVAKVFGDIVGN